MQTRRVEVAIIGAGTAGLGAFRMARLHTDSVVLIEGGAYGTTCARVGCMPSKLLIAAAEAAHQARNVQPFGINVTGDIEIDGRAVMERVRRERDRFVGQVLDSVDKLPDLAKLRGHARFEDPHTLMIGDHTRVHADRIVIASGSRPHCPASLKDAGDHLVVNDDLFEWQTLPASVAVFGPGLIGLELGQALHRLGVHVRLFGISGSLGTLQDKAVRDYADRTFNEAFYLDPEATVERIAHEDDGVAITFLERTTRERLTERFDVLLAATGRRPNTDRLALEKAGLRLDDQGTPLFNPYTLQCRNSDDSPCHVFIAGDANHALPLLHEASDEGRIAGENAGRYPEVRAGHRRAFLSVVFTEPQIARVGLGYAELERRYGNCGCLAIGEVSFEKQGRARVMGVNQGLMRVYAEHGSGLFLGAEIFGPRAEHLAHLLAWALQQRQTVSQMLEMPFYHPVIEEGVRTALRDLHAKLLLGPAILEHSMECGPGD